MLILTRKTGESIQISDEIELIVVGVRNNSEVVLGLKAPRDVRIVRSELVKGEDKTHGDKEEKVRKVS